MLNARTGLDCPWLIATASRAPDSPAVSAPPQPEGLAAAGFQVSVSICGTPSAKRTGMAGAGRHAAESHSTCPLRVTITWTAPAPNDSVHTAALVETA
jgi:hypothetical protein